MKRVVHLASLGLERFFLHTWRRMDEDWQARLAAQARPDYRPLLVSSVTAACMLIVFTFGKPGYLSEALGRAPGTPGLLEYCWWSCTCVLGYIALPAWFIKTFLRQPLRAYGLGKLEISSDWHACVALALGAVPCIALVAATVPSFSDHYPLYPEAAHSLGALLAWEAIYIVQFIGVEFFFRGFLLNALRPSLGSHAIFIAMIPYAIAHAGKPAPEAFGAIVAGIFLGTLAARTGTIWSGLMLHVVVAVSMDCASLVVKARFPLHW